MYVKVRTMDGSQTAVLNISKLTNVEDFRVMVNDKLKVPVDRQRLFFRGKQMEDGYNMFAYDINTNDVIQLMVKPVLTEINTNVSKPSLDEKKICHSEDKENVQNNNQKWMKNASKYYNVGDLVDAKYLNDGSWWEAKIQNININPEAKEVTAEDDGFLYHIVFEKYEDDLPCALILKHIRPRAHQKVTLNDLSVGDFIMANYNVKEPGERGHWYDCEVTDIKNTRKEKLVTATLFFGPDATPLECCNINLINELFKIEKNIKLDQRSWEMEKLVAEGSPVKRLNAPKCSTCKDNPKRKCKDCSCQECGGKESPEKQLMCDECDMAFHIYCLNPPLDAIPEVDDWFCPLCKNDDSEIVKAGEKLKQSKKKAKMASSTTNSSRDWGKGFACAGRQKICTLVPQNHFGSIPGVEVGTLWKFRLQASEAGVHRPHVAGIHGRENEGAYSIVLSGGYEDDEDNGDTFTYTGSGGRDLSGNKRTAEQSCDQLLTRMNKALALNCNVAVDKNGAEAKDWKGGKPVRVVRNSKGRKHSKYAPEEGNRYDGLYKVVKYWQDVGKSGFKVWRYLLKRDDPIPAPWTKEGKVRIQELGLEMQYPEGYLEAQREKEAASRMEKESSSSDNEDDKKKTKRKSVSEHSSAEHSSAKKRKSACYTLEKDVEKLIKKDKKNKKLWAECELVLPEGKSQFLSCVEEKFLCICCQDIVFNPVTTECKHNVCQSCLQRSFKADIFTCPACRYDLGQGFKMIVNKELKGCLTKLFPGYEVGR